MEVILREDIEKLGSRGQVVKVAPGYARNFLLPRRMAVAATESNRKIVEQERQGHPATRSQGADGRRGSRKADELRRSDDRSEGRRIGSVIRFRNRCRYRSSARKTKATTIERRKIQLAEPIKTLGDFKVAVKLHREVSVEIPVHVVREE